MDSPHNQLQDSRIDALEKGQADILALLKPISETYQTIAVLGRWGSAILVTISIFIGVVLGLREYFRN
jgi:hypothetical protein